MREERHKAVAAAGPVEEGSTGSRRVAKRRGGVSVRPKLKRH